MVFMSPLPDIWAFVFKVLHPQSVCSLSVNHLFRIFRVFRGYGFLAGYFLPGIFCWFFVAEVPVFGLSCHRCCALKIKNL